jgi:hypothetical protein
VSIGCVSGHLEGQETVCKSETNDRKHTLSLGCHKYILGYLGLKKKFRLRREPSSGISLSGGQVSDGRLCRGLIAVTEHTHDMFYTHITSIPFNLKRTQFWVRDNEKVVFNYDIHVNNITIDTYMY